MLPTFLLLPATPAYAFWKSARSSRCWSALAATIALIAASGMTAAQPRADAQEEPTPAALMGEAAATDALVQRAREAARSDRNREAADLFGQALERSPERRHELLREYADQLTYSDRSRQAVALYREVLAADPSAEQRQQALRGMGLALLWSDRPGPARAVYQQLLDELPGDRDARRNLARAMSWSGRQRAAAAELQALLDESPDDHETRRLLAQAQAWMGRPDRARDTLAGAPAANGDDSAALRRDLAHAAAIRTRLDLQQSHQSDDLDIRAAQLVHEIALDGGRGLAGVELGHLDFRGDSGDGSVRVSRPMLLGRYRFSDALELNARLGNERIASGDRPGLDRTVYASWLTWWPGDTARVDLSTSRATLDNLRSLRAGLTATQHGLSVDLTPNERQRYNARIERGLFSDGNRRRAGQVSGEFRWHRALDAWVGLRHARMVFSEQLDNGYFNPRDLHATQLTLRMGYRANQPEALWDVAASAAVGREYADPGGSKPTLDIGLRAGWRLDDDTRLEARLQRTSSRTNALNGFERTTLGLSLTRHW